MFFARLGSLNALEKTGRSHFWPSWLGGELPSADSVGRICAALNHETLRLLNRHVYLHLKRAKALPSPWHGICALVLDGHETHCTYRRRCSGCLQRVVKTGDGERIQYYHRHVTAKLVAGDLHFLVDAEPQLPGEDEVACALRLLERVLQLYARAFDVVLADALYADPRFFNFLSSRGKYALTVLKDERRDLVKDATALFDLAEPEEFTQDRKSYQCWDLEGFTSWPQVDSKVRVVRSHETSTIERQLDGKREERLSQWLWVTTLPAALASTRAVVQLGHARWTIENQGFNETTNHWHADHVYKHQSEAMLSFWLLCIVAVNAFRAFFVRNIKPVVRARTTMTHVARQVSAELYGQIPAPYAQPP